MYSFLTKIEQLIITNLPGEKAWVRMMPKGRILYNNNEPVRKASVLILLYQKKKDLYLVLIKRTVDNGPHSGQISLPGGIQEENDKNSEETARREMQEETGVCRHDIKIIGKLSNLLITVSKTEVSPFIGYIDYTPDFIPDPIEVEYLVEVNLKTLLDPGIVQSEIMDLSGNTVNVPFYNFNGEKIWGATAMILAEFIDLAEKAVQDPHAQY